MAFPPDGHESLVVSTTIACLWCERQAIVYLTDCDAICCTRCDFWVQHRPEEGINHMHDKKQGMRELPTSLLVCGQKEKA